MYRQYLADPSSVSPAWQDFFSDYSATGASTVVASAPANGARAVPAPVTPVPSMPIRQEPPAEPKRVSDTAPLVLEGDEPKPIRGAAARIVENMEASLGVPTATSVRNVPAKLLEVNRQILNNHLSRTGRGKVSFTHLIAYAAVQAVRRVPAMASGYGVVDGGPVVVRHDHINLGLAVDVAKSDGSRTLLVPNLRAVETLDFAGFFAAYEEMIRKVRTGKITPDDFAGTTGTITNPGMIGTVHSVPRLMPGQGFILGVGSIGYPAEYEGADPHTVARLGISKIITLTSTYDHRVIQGAESGEFLRSIHDLLLGKDGFYDEIFQSFSVPYEPARWSTDISPLDDEAAHNEKVVHVHQLVNMYRVRGHLIANLDPLGRREPDTHPELDITHYGLSIWDLDREFPIGSLAGGTADQKTMPLRDILGVLRDAYSRSVGVEFMHMQEPDQKEWIQEHVERRASAPDPAVQHRILDRLNAAEAFEGFLHRKYLGQKRFSLEGAESLIPMLDALLSAAADGDMAEMVLGTAHRGRLNVLVNTVGKGYGQIFREFEGALDPSSVQGSGDVKYHVGATGTHTAPSGKQIGVSLASNPSHLEAVDPVVEGMARAKGDRIDDSERCHVLPVLVHGDAAFAGQGVVAETLNLSEVPGYEVGGTIHIVVNNQLGFTTAPELGRSGVYATDIAKMVQAPIFHVNGDDPEACVRVVQLAYEFRQRFHKDVVVDMVCYRRYGHNEGDEPAFTQPKMYQLIRARRSVRKLYTETLVNRGDFTLAEAEAALEDFQARLNNAFEETHSSGPPTIPVNIVVGEQVETAVETGVDRAKLQQVIDALVGWPDDFAINPKLEKILRARATDFAADQIDWALAESLAFGTMALEGVPVRLSGQDTRRGTFSQRHGVLVDSETEAEFCPLRHIADDQAPVMLYDSVLSEYAALGFEYGYAVADDRAWVGWEAQFGDFMNGAQIIIDQFIVAAEDKWGQQSRLALLLPHGFEGQGPEHSSARIERFLALCAESNLRVCYPTTAAQYFHLLRRQIYAPARKPLVCFTPKKYLRIPATRSRVDALSSGSFQEILDDPRLAIDPANVTRVLLCSGKVAHELMDRRDELGAPVAIVRVEQLYPWPEDQLIALAEKYTGCNEVYWVQEEPANMGPWNYVHGKLHRILRDRATLRHIARPPSPSPASGSSAVHDREQENLLLDAFADVPAS
ncbi:MAG: multifunctional oxoglutarate decarboxylase/oxoglutarate dehydrogenase thiamine pyrophosphate-binding subunit/dihydrolipoyllysine-residue succinyltransferase subunit [Acidimicrobiia bacterium]|nr:multifunctional oxoglutarate decarboxylase/oxoglutarate dehydrogenase thiamine pyrophosphate-binding subunit/dihydrolipoyllysine-residue succinyltransferase subunit [Acidimicrobiia bacterium]